MWSSRHAFPGSAPRSLKRQPAGGQRKHELINACEPALALLDKLRLERERRVVRNYGHPFGGCEPRLLLIATIRDRRYLAIWLYLVSRAERAGEDNQDVQRELD
jgi:hypothetical protein